MTNTKFFIFGRVIALLMLTSIMLFPVSSVFAAGATSFTQTFHNATDSFVTDVPCHNFQATVNITYNGVFHINVNPAGDSWVTGTQTGTVVAVPLDPSNPTFTGRFTTWFGSSDNNQNSVDHSTFSVRAVGSDGSTIQFHETAHMSTNANGVVLTFDKPVCG